MGVNWTFCFGSIAGKSLVECAFVALLSMMLARIVRFNLGFFIIVAFFKEIGCNYLMFCSSLTVIVWFSYFVVRCEYWSASFSN